MTNQPNDRDKMLEKLRKLFALGNSPNQHEAELAMAKANELMREHQISADQIDMHEAGNISGSDIFIVANAGGARHWVWVLADAAAKLFDGRALHAGTTGEMRIRFVGTKTDMQAMKMMFDHLWKSWLSIVEADLRNEKDRVRQLTIGDMYWPPATTMKYKHGHGVGFADVVNKRVQELVEERRASVEKSATGRDLIVVKGQALANWMKDNSRQGGNASSTGSGAGMAAGARAGQAIPLGGGIGGHAQARQIAHRGGSAS